MEGTVIEFLVGVCVLAVVWFSALGLAWAWLVVVDEGLYVFIPALLAVTVAGAVAGTLGVIVLCSLLGAAVLQ
jgi:hypothetical protein